MTVMKKLALFFVALLALTSSVWAAETVVTVKGSDTMVILGQRWAEQYMKRRPGAQIQVTGGGSGTGISALINGTTDICAASRVMKPSERKKLRERYATPGVEIPVAMDGLAVYVNQSNPVGELSFQQLRDIFSGRVTNWKQLGGPEATIIVYSRENSSGTYVFFKDLVLGGSDFTARAQALPGTAAVVNAVVHERNSIGYGGAAYAKGIKVLRVRRDASSPAVAPSAQAVAAGTYPLARPLYYYLRSEPRGAIKDYLDWVLSPAGQAIATEVGFFPLRSGGVGRADTRRQERL
jgi:phosphate transport system substrate-binding protein